MGPQIFKKFQVKNLGAQNFQKNQAIKKKNEGP